MPEQYPPLITISGPPGSGTTTLTDRLAASREYETVSGGDIFRQQAQDRGMSLAEFTELAEEDDSIDRELDDRLRTILENHVNGDRTPDGRGLIVESRLAGWLAPETHLSVWLKAPIEVRIERVSDRTETVDELRAREESEARRYQSYYDIDINDLSTYDLVIDTETLTTDGVSQLVDAALDDIVPSESA